MTLTPDAAIALHMTTGKEVNKTANMTVQCFVHLSGREVIHFTAHQDHEARNLMVQHGRGTSVPARNNIVSAIGGSWSSNDYLVAEGSLLKFAINKRGQALGTTSVQFFIKVRAAAAHRRINIGMGLGADSTVRSGVIEGRFDILTLDEAIEEGARVEANFHRFFSPSLYGRVFTITELSPEDAPRARRQVIRVQTTSGQERVVTRPTRVRNLDL